MMLLLPCTYFMYISDLLLPKAWYLEAPHGTVPGRESMRVTTYTDHISENKTAAAYPLGDGFIAHDQFPISLLKMFPISLALFFG